MATQWEPEVAPSPVPTDLQCCDRLSKPERTGSTTPHLVFGYLRVEEPDETEIAKLRDELASFCLGQGLRLGGVFCDRGIPGDVVARVGFAGALDALRVPDCFALLVPSREHLSAVELVEQTLVRMVNRAGCRVLSLPATTDTTAATKVALLVAKQADQAEQSGRPA